MTNFSIKETAQSIKTTEKDYIVSHPVVAPLVNTGIACVGGGIMGAFMPLDADSFVRHAICKEADEYRKNAHLEYAKLKDVLIPEERAKIFENVNKNVRKVRMFLGDEAFEKLSDLFPDKLTADSMMSDAKYMTSIDVKEEKQQYVNMMVDNFKKLKKGDKELSKKYSDIIKDIKKMNIKNLAFIFGLSTAVISGLYSYNKYNETHPSKAKNQ